LNAFLVPQKLLASTAFNQFEISISRLARPYISFLPTPHKEFDSAFVLRELSTAQSTVTCGSRAASAQNAFPRIHYVTHHVTKHLLK
jgi:hypothetical protein